MITNYLKQTLNYIIDHLQTEVKRHFNLSVVFILVMGLAVICIAIIYTLLTGYVYGHVYAADSLSDFILRISGDKYLVEHVTSLVSSLTILGYGLYGSFVISCMNDIQLQGKEKYKWGDFRAYISRDEWMWFVRFVVVILIFYFISFRDLKMWVYYGKGPSEIYVADGLPGQGVFLYRLLNWLDLIILLIRYYLPFILAILFIITVYENKIRKELILKYKPAIYASLILSFVIAQLGAVIITYFKTYVGGLIDVFLYTRITVLFPGTFRGVAALCLGALCVWPIATAICMPIKLQSEEGYEAMPEALFENTEIEPADEILPE